MPGFLAGDQTLGVLYGWLRRVGYRPTTCGFVTNTDCSDRALDRVERKVEALWRRHGRSVALLGQAAAATSPVPWGSGGPTVSRTPSRWERT